MTQQKALALKTGKVIIVTGASKGIGKAIGDLLGQHHKIALISRNIETLEELANNRTGVDTFLAISADVTKEDEVSQAVTKVLDTFGTIDVLINNAGIGTFKRIDKFTLEEFTQVIDTNLIGTFLFTKYVVPTLIKNKAGQIINIASVAGLNGFKSGTAYAASKFGQIGFTESLREDLKEYGIAVTTIAPGGVRTTFGGKSLTDERDYLLEPEDVARTVEYLVNESETANAKLIELKPRRGKKFR